MAIVSHGEVRIRPVRLRGGCKKETSPHLRSSELLDMFSCLWHSAHSVLLALVSFATLTFLFFASSACSLQAFYKVEVKCDQSWR